MHLRHDHFDLPCPKLLNQFARRPVVGLGVVFFHARYPAALNWKFRLWLKNSSGFS